MENVFETITYTIRLWNKNEAEAVHVNAEHPNKHKFLAALTLVFKS